MSGFQIRYVDARGAGHVETRQTRRDVEKRLIELGHSGIYARAYYGSTDRELDVGAIRVEKVPLLPFVEDDGGRAAAGFRGSTGDCVVRAIAIAGDLGYREVYARLFAGAREFNAKAAARGRKTYPPSPRTGVLPDVYKPFLAELGAVWVPTRRFGEGCRVHVRADELPLEGRRVLRLSKHLVALVDGVLRDTADPSREGTRGVYGYWTFP